MVVIAILVWKRKFKNKININSAGVPEGTTSPIEMGDVDSSSQLKALDKLEEAEEEVNTDLDNPKSD